MNRVLFFSQPNILNTYILFLYERDICHFPTDDTNEGESVQMGGESFRQGRQRGAKCWMVK